MRLQQKLFALCIVITLCFASLAQTGSRKRKAPPKIRYPNLSTGRGKSTSRGAATEKLSAELRILNNQFATARGASEPDTLSFSAQELQNLFDIPPDNLNPSVNVTIEVASQLDLQTLRAQGAKIYLQLGNKIYADVPVLSLENLAGRQWIVSIAAMKSSSLPPSPAAGARLRSRPPGVSRGISPSFTAAPQVKVDSDFEKGGLTGKGVIVGVVDSGIDWRHPDFRRPDGSSRILYLWDMLDSSYKTSGGRIGSPAPVLFPDTDTLPGTVYTNAQINKALKGTGTINSMDNFGHGTAVAGTAAGNGRATANGLLEGTYTGVAPEADLMIVKAGNCSGIISVAYLGTWWIAQTAQTLGRPVVINHSYGGHFSVHDGNGEEEAVMNYLVGAGKSGVAITVAAGNEGRYSMHASGRFGPQRPGQADVSGSPIELSVIENSAVAEPKMIAAFKSEDDWGLAILGSRKFLADEAGKSQVVYIYKLNGAIKASLASGVKETPEFVRFANSVLEASSISTTAAGQDTIVVPLPPDEYYVWGLGISEKVKNGRFDLYLPYYLFSRFTYGADKNLMVSSPGTASNAITVGAYDFRGEWTNQSGTSTTYNIALSRISDYSNPGGRRSDGVFKPDIVAPATFTISSLSHGAVVTPPVCDGGSMANGLGENSVTRDGYHIAWDGTSASAPFTAGVIALMLQKNPNLDSKQIRDILIATAIKGDEFVGATPNPEWGYGKINPAAAIASTPAISPVAVKP